MNTNNITNSTWKPGMNATGAGENAPWGIGVMRVRCVWIVGVRAGKGAMVRSEGDRMG
jgi:hypothetical protein